ncbi:uncharacterized protein [Littorina saxatilis]|uniref:Uncharacterized protein n=1 Tax=Littorina saxatilis TaxID=31220 RepID=A0AAN9ATQ6_9CAEN
MASTRFRMISVALFVMALSVLEAIQWDRGSVNNAQMTACVGGKASIPWVFVAGKGETVASLAWSFKAPDEKKKQIATVMNGHFYTTDNIKFGFLPNAGLALYDTRSQDSGNYSVQVGVLRSDFSPVSAGRTITLSVTDTPPFTTDGDLHVTLSDAVRDDVTKDWTVQLHCGQFSDRGHPPVGVVWTTPSGEVRSSSYENNGTFVLPVSSPFQEGNYSCRLSPSAPAGRCLAATSPLKGAGHLYVNDKDFRLTLLEALLQETIGELQETNTRQSKLIGDFTDQIHGLNSKLNGLRLVNGTHPWEGRVELFVHGMWGTVCDDHWDASDARVVCRHLGYNTSNAQAWPLAHYGQGPSSAPIWLDDVECQGSEVTLRICKSQPVGKINCGHKEDAGVSCGGI